jgi:hypothetical protein
MVKRVNRDKREVDPSHNDVTGDRLISKLRNQSLYAQNWEAIFGKKGEQLEIDFEPDNQEDELPEPEVLKQ